MSVTIAKANFPAFTDNAQVSGKRIVTFLNYGTGATQQSPQWVVLGGVTSNSLSLSAGTNDAQTKDQGYWSESVITSKTLTYSAEMVLKRGSVSQAAVDFFMYDDDTTAEKGSLDIAVVDLDTLEYTRMNIIPTSWEQTAGSEEAVTYSLSATVTGRPQKLTSFVVPS